VEEGSRRNGREKEERRGRKNEGRKSKNEPVKRNGAVYT